MAAMRCKWCETALHYVHGHGACLNKACPMFGLNQAECCDGETCQPLAETATAARR